MNLKIAAALAGFCACVPIAQASNFDKGSLRVGINLGAGSAFGDSYTLAGIGIGYYVLTGLELGLDAQTWLGGDTRIYQVTPSTTYVFTQLEAITPYLGVLYRKTSIEGLADIDAYGGRAGMVLNATERTYVHAGLVAIEYQDCDERINERIFESCSEVYPEVSIGFAY